MRELCGGWTSWEVGKCSSTLCKVCAFILLGTNTDQCIDPDIAVRRKTAFLINTLLLQDTKTGSTAAALHASDGPQVHGAEGSEAASTEGLVQKAVTDHKLIRALVQPPPYGPDGDEDATKDSDYREKVFQVLDTFSQSGGELGDAEGAVRVFREARGA